MPPLALPGPQVGPSRASTRGATAPNNPGNAWEWFPTFIKQELSPYPGRVRIVTRMVIAASVAMLMIMSFHLVGAGIAGVYTLIVSRESPQATFRSAWIMLVSYLFGTVYLIVGLLLFINYPLTHFLWVVVNLFLSFYALRVFSNNIAAAAFGIMTTLVIPSWDVTAPTELLLVETLWTAGGIGIGLGVTVLVEYAFSSFGARSDLVGGLRERLDAVANVVDEYSSGQISCSTQEKLADLATVGLSRLRTLATEPHLQRYGSSERKSTISLVGRLVDLAVAFHPQFGNVESKDGSEECARLKCLADRMRWVSASLDRNDETIAFPPEPRESAAGPVWMSEFEHTTHLLTLSLSLIPEEQPASVAQENHQHVPWLAPGAFTNTEHLQYALKGCLAASLCYVFINAVAYQGIRTALVTCFITSLTSTGASRQKQLLRLIGAVVGGLIFGVGGQAIVLPMLDGIAGFTMFFVFVTWLSAWVATSSTRLSYLGIQMALAFYLINLQEPYPQTNLTIGRDRVLGIGLGLVAMWLIFDVVGGAKPAVTAMRDILRTAVSSLADFVELSKPGDVIDLQRIRSLRDNIASSFGLLNAQADGVLFETGERRQRDLAERAKLLAFQTRLRSLFFLEIGLIHYRVDVEENGFSAAVNAAQLSFNALVARELRSLVKVLGGGIAAPSSRDVWSAHRALKRSLEATSEMQIQDAEAMLGLTSGIAAVMEALQQEIRPSR